MSGAGSTPTETMMSIQSGRVSMMSLEQVEPARSETLEGVEAESMSALLGVMSTELRTLLKGVLGLAEAMTPEELSLAQRQRLRAVQESGETLLALLREPVVAEAPPPMRVAQAFVPPQPSALRLLAAEDNPTNQLLLRTLLGAAGIEPHIVSNGEEAVAAWKSGHWDMILMDIQMPVMDGTSAARAIREQELREGRMRTPIIALTANSIMRHRAEYLGAGMDEVVAKPIHLATLLQAMERALDLSEEQPARAAV
jgi:CheY-like chemotaxis protein